MSQASFQNHRPSPKEKISRTVNFALIRGTPMGPNPGATADDQVAVPATGPHFLGFLSRDVTADGPTFLHHTIPGYEGRFELPEKVGNTVSLEHSDEFSVGDDLLVMSGTGAISGSLPSATKVEAWHGKFRQEQSAGDALWEIDAQLTPLDGETVRVRLKPIANS